MPLAKTSPQFPDNRALPRVSDFFSLQTVCANAKPNPMAKPNVQRGTAQFQQSCSQCHGAEATGGAGPNLIESSLVRHDENGDLIAP